HRNIADTDEEAHRSERDNRGDHNHNTGALHCFTRLTLNGNAGLSAGAARLSFNAAKSVFAERSNQLIDADVHCREPSTDEVPAHRIKVDNLILLPRS